jgi:hypothetical protein
MGKMFQNASSLKPLVQLKPNCPGMIIGRPSTNFLLFMLIGNPRWLPEDLPMIIPGQFGFNCPKWFERRSVLKHFSHKMFQNASSLKPLVQLKPNCPGMIIGRSSTNLTFFVPISCTVWL